MRHAGAPSRPVVATQAGEKCCPPARPLVSPAPESIVPCALFVEATAAESGCLQYSVPWRVALLLAGTAAGWGRPLRFSKPADLPDAPTYCPGGPRVLVLESAARANSDREPIQASRN